MKTLSPSASVLSCLAAAACLMVPCTPATAAQPYREETHGPRIGTRILYFVKDLVYGDNPSDRYRHLPRNQPQQQQQQQPNYNVRPQGQRYSLDQPPPMNSQPRPRPPQYPVQPPPAPRDMPYTSPDAPPPPRENYQANAGGQEEDIPPVKVKPKTPTPKSAPAPKPSAEEVADSKPAVQPPKREIPMEGNPPSTQTVSSNAAAAKKSWQAFSGDTPAPAPPPPTVETKTSTPPAVSGNSATLTGSKTTKEGRVKSPYPPYNELDVTGLPAGSLAMDPTTGKVFRVP